MALRPLLVSLAVLLGMPTAGRAQDAATWRWTWDGNVFFGVNRQDRRYVDVTAYDRIPLVNCQHPHDLPMNLGATYRFVRPGVSYVLGADLVGTPTIGPTPFMHRASARDNPQVPLTHHYFDSTHSTPGVVRGGVEWKTITLGFGLPRRGA